jgi:hypothetical protein
LILYVTAVLVAACGVVKLGTDNRKVQAMFDAEKSHLERQASSGEITWVQATSRTRDLDKSLAGRADLDTTWKFDRDDEEYHAYSIAIAERLDGKQITFAEFDSLRIARLNSIRTRAESLSLQRRAARQANLDTLDVGGSGATCTKKREWISGFNKNCVYSCLGGEAVQTVRSTDLCPLTIER